jgi:hypothetical protein
VLGHQQRLVNPQTGPPQDDDQPTYARATDPVAAERMTAMISSIRGGSTQPLPSAAA